MLNFLFLFEILLACAVIYGLVLLVRYVKGRTNILVRNGSTDVLSELGELRKDKSDASAGYEVRLSADTNKVVGKVVVKDEVGWVYLPKTDESYSSDKVNYRKIGYVDAEGYIYVARKGQEPERIGYLARPSAPTVPTIVGERNWRDLKWTSRLNVYYGDPSGWETEEVETVELVDPNVAQDVLENDTIEQSQPMSPQSFAATPPRRRAKAAQSVEEIVAEEPIVASDVVVEEPVIEEPVVEEPIPEIQVEAEEQIIEEPLVDELSPSETIEELVEIPQEDEQAVEPAVEEPDLEETVVAEEMAPEEMAAEEPLAKDVEIPIEEQPVVTGDQSFVYRVDEKEAAHLEYVKKNYPDVIAQIKREMVKVEGGSFIMGVDDLEAQASDYDTEKNEGPAHKVNLDSYCIGRYPVTQKQWTAIMGYNNSSQLNDDFPIAPVDWNECMLFISRLNELTGLKFALPTEAQWEFAARGGNKSNGYIYAGSNSKGTVVSDTQYSPVGKKKPNELGLYDMSGLVREWCSDWYVLRYSEEEQFNPMGPAMPEDPLERKHVVRSPFGNETVTNRKGELPENPQNFKSYGFRLASEPDKAMGIKVKPVLVGHVNKVGFYSSVPKGCPVTEEARAGAYALFYYKYGKNTYSEYIGQSPYGWKDTALLTTLVYSVLFFILYFVNTSVLQMPLLGEGLGSILVLTMFYFLLWAAIRFIKVEAAENGHSFQPLLTLMNKTLGHRFINIFIIVIGVLAAVWTFLLYDPDLIPLILAIVIGVAVNMSNKLNSYSWNVINPMHEVKELSALDDEEEETDLIPAPEGDVRKDYDWKLDSFVGKQIKAHIAVSFVQSEVFAQRNKNPFFLEKPDLSVADYKNYVCRMKTELINNEKYLLHTKYVLQEINRISNKYELNEIDSLQFVLDFIQESIAYELDSESRELAMPKEYIRYPDEVLFDQKGDCDCKAFLAMVMYYLMGYDVILLLSKDLGHSAVAVSVKQSETIGFISKDRLDDITVEINGRKYFYCETTTDGFLIGDINEGINVDRFETRIEWVHTEDEED